METVAPHAGAWIETIHTVGIPPAEEVAPHAGAWIETTRTARAMKTSSTSHPTRVRGLKLRHFHAAGGRGVVAPHAGAWIETGPPATRWSGPVVSHPTRVRGLKQKVFEQFDARYVSHPTRVRGLKHCHSTIPRQSFVVAPHAGAWIETNEVRSAIRHAPVAPHAGAWIETTWSSPD